MRLALSRFLLGWGFLGALLAFCCCLAEIERHRTVDKRRRRRLLTVGRYAVVWRMIETETMVIGIENLNSFERESVGSHALGVLSIARSSS